MGDARAVTLIVKADVQGTAEAVRDALLALSSRSAAVKIAHLGVGPLTSSDVNLAAAVGGKLVAFGVRPPPPDVEQLRQAKGVEVRRGRGRGWWGVRRSARGKQRVALPTACLWARLGAAGQLLDKSMQRRLLEGAGACTHSLAHYPARPARLLTHLPTHPLTHSTHSRT